MEGIEKLLLAYVLGMLTVMVFVVIYLIKHAKPVINADQYIAEQQQKVAKIKQKGEGNSQTSDLRQILTKRDERKRKRDARRAERKAVLSDSGQNKNI